MWRFNMAKKETDELVFFFIIIRKLKTIQVIFILIIIISISGVLILSTYLRRSSSIKPLFSFPNLSPYLLLSCRCGEHINNHNQWSVSISFKGAICNLSRVKTRSMLRAVIWLARDLLAVKEFASIFPLHLSSNTDHQAPGVLKEASCC